MIYPTYFSWLEYTTFSVSRFTRKNSFFGGKTTHIYEPVLYMVVTRDPWIICKIKNKKKAVRIRTSYANAASVPRRDKFIAITETHSKIKKKKNHHKTYLQPFLSDRHKTTRVNDMPTRNGRNTSVVCAFQRRNMRWWNKSYPRNYEKPIYVGRFTVLTLWMCLDVNINRT